MDERTGQLLPFIINWFPFEFSRLFFIEKFTPQKAGKLERVDLLLLLDILDLLGM